MQVFVRGVVIVRAEGEKEERGVLEQTSGLKDPDVIMLDLAEMK